MAHEKVYGICEDKCKVEVYGKGSNVYEIPPTKASIRTTSTNTVAQIKIDYPEGFTYDNCYAIGLYRYDLEGPWSTMSSGDGITNQIVLGGQIEIYTYFHDTQEIGFDVYFKVLLIKKL